MISSVGLLSHAGLDHFYDIATDCQLMGDKSRRLEHYLFKNLTPYGGQNGRAKIEWEEKRRRQYREHLKQVREPLTYDSHSTGNAANRSDKIGYTRDTYQDADTKIKIKAVAV